MHMNMHVYMCMYVYPAACGKSRHRASPACSVAIVREGIGGILDVRWDIYRERPLGGLLEAVLRPLGGCLGVSWGPLGVLLGLFGGLLGPPGGLFGHKDRVVGVYSPSWTSLGAVWGLSWAVLGASEAVLRPSWAVLGPSWGPLGASWGALGGPWSRLGASEARKGDNVKKA